MTIASTIACPHCGAQNPATAAFCESCGKALPGAQRSGPRIVGANEMPTTAVGHQMVSDELTKTQKSASTALLVVAIIQIVIGGLLVLVRANAQTAAQSQLTVLMAAQLGVAALFWALWFWSRRAPLPASIVALIVYCTLVALNVVTSLKRLADNPDAARGPFGGVGIGIMDIIIIAVLARAIAAGLKHRRLAAARTEAGM
jgi:hypothetical protein